MARNSGPVTPVPRWPEPSQGQGASRQDQGFGQGQPSYPNDPRQYPPAPGQGQAPNYPQQPAPPYPDPGYADPAGYDQGHYDPYQQPQFGAPQDGYGAPPVQQHPAYAPQFEPYQPQPQPPQQPPQPAAQWAPAGYAAPAPPPYPQQTAPGHDGGGYGDPQAYRGRDARMPAPEPVYRAPAPHLRGPAYDQNPGWPAPASDPYAQQQPGWGGQQNYEDSGQGFAPADPYAYGGMPQAPGYGAGDYAPQHYAQEDQGFGATEAPYLPPQHHQDQAVAGEYDPDEVAYEDEDGHGRGRFVKIAAAIVVAIGLGGGLAYGYKSFFGSDRSGKPPVVRTADTPAKEKPADPGGKKFAHTDSKILGRLSDGSDKAVASTSAAGSAQAEASDPSGTRKVSTMIIGRDGSIVDSSPSQPPPSALPPSASPVPGMTIVDGFGARRPQAAAVVQPPAAPPSEPVKAQVAAPSKVPQPSKPIVISRAEPETAEPEAAPAQVETPKAPPKQKVAKAEIGTSPAASGAGYVAVLASIPSSASSRMEALKQFADLQQKYAGQLGSKTPDVQEANLGTKGNFHRLVVGPPGSRQQATQLCSDLKAAGYASCWVKSY